MRRLASLNRAGRSRKASFSRMRSSDRLNSSSSMGAALSLGPRLTTLESTLPGQLYQSDRNVTPILCRSGDILTSILHPPGKIKSQPTRRREIPTWHLTDDNADGSQGARPSPVSALSVPAPPLIATVAALFRRGGDPLLTVLGAERFISGRKGKNPWGQSPQP